MQLIEPLAVPPAMCFWERKNLTGLLTASSAFANDVTKSVEDALKFGNGAAVKFNLNYRYENANQEEVPNPLLNGRPLPAARQPQTANANTMRLRLGLLSPVFHGLQGFAEYQGLYAMQSDYNSTRNGKTGYTVIADPYENELDQLCRHSGHAYQGRTASHQVR